MKCKACGAPIEAGEEKCPYCGTLTDYGEEKFKERESRKKEDERRKMLENLPAMKYVSMTFVALLYVVTIGIYSVYWYAMRIKPLNSLGTKTKLPAWLVGIFALLYAYIVIVPSYDLTAYGISEEIAESCFGVARVHNREDTSGTRGKLHGQDSSRQRNSSVKCNADSLRCWLSSVSGKQND